VAKGEKREKKSIMSVTSEKDVVKKRRGQKKKKSDGTRPDMIEGVKCRHLNRTNRIDKGGFVTRSEGIVVVTKRG